MNNKVYFNQYEKLVSNDLKVAIAWKVFCCIRLIDYKFDVVYKENIDRSYPEFQAIAAMYLFSSGLDDLT